MNFEPKQLTPWFQTAYIEYPNKNRSGLYQVLSIVKTLSGESSQIEAWVYWSGRAFGQVCLSQDAAMRHSISKVRRPIVWRGLMGEK